MLRTALLATVFAASLASGANALDFADEGAPLTAFVPGSAPAAAAVAWSAVPGPGFLATEGGYIRVVDAEPARATAAMAWSAVPALGHFATEGGYIAVAAPAGGTTVVASSPVGVAR